MSSGFLGADAEAFILKKDNRNSGGVVEALVEVCLEEWQAYVAACHDGEKGGGHGVELS
jgi:hypothetical protein